MSRQLLAESIRIDGQTQSRERINEETVKEYAEAMQAPPGSRPSPAWPPVTVFFDGTEFWMADGFHRLLAVRRIGKKNIAAHVKKGTREDAAWAACGANQTHGLRRTNADKRKAVEMALKLHPEMSNGAIAEHCGVSHTFAGDMRRQVATVATSTASQKRVGKDGKNYTVKTKKAATEGIGPPPTAEENAKREQKPGEASAERDEAPEANTGEEEPEPGGEKGKLGLVPVSPRPTPPPPPKPVDGVGRLLPENLVELWNRGKEVQDMVAALSKIRVALRNAQDNKDPLFSSVPISSLGCNLRETKVTDTAA